MSRAMNKWIYISRKRQYFQKCLSIFSVKFLPASLFNLSSGKKKLNSTDNIENKFKETKRPLYETF